METNKPKPTANMKILMPLALILLVLAAPGCKKEPTGYETTSVFVPDQLAYDAKRELSDKIADGWKVLSDRRAWIYRSSVDRMREKKTWGTEYNLGRNTYK